MENQLLQSHRYPVVNQLKGSNVEPTPSSHSSGVVVMAPGLKEVAEGGSDVTPAAADVVPDDDVNDDDVDEPPFPV